MEKSNGGLKLLDVLLVVFIILKLLKVITWSWWLVLTPLWIQLAIAVIGIIVIVILEKE
jgi:hypothetical protein